MAILTVSINKEKDLPALKEILNLFGLTYIVTDEDALSSINTVLENSEKELNRLYEQAISLIKD
jgi:hypothetical protein